LYNVCHVFLALKGQNVLLFLLNHHISIQWFIY